ncbi:hypothetical protein KIH39_10340 [Telmatocola sphagniphila]|uniref:DUF4013 domain-containing protein n=1 Tax=Telmatocola sphagniphila TaxID=1123043 RepID=A0A8E6BCC2_9BACT|nr:hypothetical protein [Telmatocola sphagniphila]QVL34280.1 hypothetical protein KIH39_10340 [Telmatocola sphagniphila]
MVWLDSPPEVTLEDPIEKKSSPPSSVLKVFVHGVQWIFGLVSMLVALAFLAAIPILQFLSLGYMLESAARISRSGRIRDGFIGIRLASRLGIAVAASWLLVLPIRFLSDIAISAEIINPGSRKAADWRMGVYLLAALTAVHIAMAIARGGKLRYFLWPFNFLSVMRELRRGDSYARARDATWDFVISLRLPYFFWLGLRGFAGAFVWLFIPVTLLAMGHAHFKAAPFVGVVGGLLLALVILYLPLLQLRLASENRFSAMFELRAVRRTYRNAPWAFTLAFFLTLLFALPLYLLKVEALPRETRWLPALIFMLFIFPARLFMGWAVGLANRRTQPRHWFFRWTGRIPLLPIAGVYVLVVFFSQYTSWNGVVTLYEQHAFLLPVPFLGS